MNIPGFVRRFSGWLLLVAALVLSVACGGSSPAPGTPPTITSAATTGFTETEAGTFTITATGNPTPTLSLTGALPAGVTFNASTGVLSGTPASGSNGTYPLTITATNGSSPDATMTFNLVVAIKTPTITSARTTAFTETVAGTFTVTATGSPAPTLSLTGTLPSGVTFDASTGVLSGTPAGGSNGAYPVVLTATNGSSPDATMTFDLVVVTKSTTALIVYDPTAIIDTDVTNLTSKLTAAGLTVTTNIGIPTGDLTTYAQIWDVRFNTTTPLTASDIERYSVYLASGRTLVVIGENTGFAIRNNTIVSLISFLGGGTITLTTPANAQTVLSPFTGPTTLSTITFQAAAGTSDPGSGAFITKDANNIGTALYYARGTLSNALIGRLMTVFDINFLGSSADANSQTLIANIIALP